VFGDAKPLQSEAVPLTDNIDRNSTGKYTYSLWRENIGVPMNKNDVEMIKVLAESMQGVAKAVAEGMGEGIAKAMGYGNVQQIPLPEEEPEPEMFFPDVERDGVWIDPEFGETNA
jgi:hypothetical protein